LTLAPVYVFLLPTFDPRPGVPYKQRSKEIDWVGTILIIGAFTAGVMGLSFGGVTWEWNSGRIIALFVISGVLFITFGFQQTFCIFTTLERRLFPVQFLKSRTMIILFAMTASAGTAVFLPIYFIPLFFQFVREDTALDAGVRLLPLICLMVFFCLLNGGILSKYGLYMPWYLFGGAMVLAGGACMFTVDIHTSTPSIYGYSILIGIGTGVYVQSSFSVAQARVDAFEIPQAVGFISCAQTTGCTIALAIANTIFLNGATDRIVKILPTASAEQVQGAVAGVGSAFFSSLPDDVRDKVLNAIIESMSKVYILVITAGALTVVLSLFMKREKLFMEAGGAA
jgi:MFS family permease